MVSNHPLFKGDSSPTYSLSFLEVGVFSPKTIKKSMFDIGKRIQELLDKFGMKQSELANKLGVYPSRINTYIKNQREPDIATIEKICEVFGITLSQFFNR